MQQSQEIQLNYPQQIEQLVAKTNRSKYDKKNIDAISAQIFDISAQLFARLDINDVITPERISANNSTAKTIASYNSTLVQKIMDDIKTAPNEDERVARAQFWLSVANNLRARNDFCSLNAIAIAIEKGLHKTEAKKSLQNTTFMSNLQEHINLYFEMEKGNFKVHNSQEQNREKGVATIPYLATFQGKITVGSEGKKEANQKMREEYAKKLDSYKQNLPKQYLDTKPIIISSQLQAAQEAGRKLSEELSKITDSTQKETKAQELLNNLHQQKQLLEESKKEIVQLFQKQAPTQTELSKLRVIEQHLKENTSSIQRTKNFINLLQTISKLDKIENLDQLEKWVMDTSNRMFNTLPNEIDKIKASDPRTASVLIDTLRSEINTIHACLNHIKDRFKEDPEMAQHVKRLLGITQAMQKEINFHEKNMSDQQQQRERAPSISSSHIIQLRSSQGK